MKKVLLFLTIIGFIGTIAILDSCKKNPVIPTVTTADVTNLTINSLTSGGTITADGGAEVTERGVCYGTSSNPTIAGERTTDAGTGSFVSNVTGLTPNTLYHIRAYATNSAGTAYGNDVTATTTAIVVPTLTTVDVTSITLTSAVSGGNISANGGEDVSARGVCWATTASPTITNSKTSDGTGSGAFVSNLTGLTAGVIYHVRAYATNSAGTAYGNEVTFTATPVVVPTVTTVATATSITQTTAVSGGNVTADGGAAITARGVCWATTASPTVAGSKTTDATGTGAFTSNLTALTPGTIYHVRAYATNSAGTAYGADVTFTTSPVLLATVTTDAATAVTLTTATSGGNVTAAGGGTITERGVCYATTANPTTANTKTSNGTGIGVFTSSLSGLTPGSLYHVRAFAINSAGTAYGNDVTFTTGAASIPTLTTAVPSLIALTTATSGGTITNTGGGTITVSGICWSTTANPTVTDSKTTTGTTTGTFTGNMTGLDQGTLYHVRAYATSSSGTGYGNDVTLNTNVADIENNSYKTVTIGTQVWMAENLKTTHLNDNTVIPVVADNTAWIALSTPGLSWYDNNVATNKPLYGGLYNWFAVGTAHLCPTGWHVPSDSEFNIMQETLGMPVADEDVWGNQGTTQGAQLKSATAWDGTNTSGFNALPGGYRYYLSGTFNNEGNLSYWWTSTNVDPSAIYRRLETGVSTIFRGGTSKTAGKYVRCMKD